MSEDSWRSLSKEDFENALGEMSGIMDVSVNDLIQITEKARKYAQLRQTEALLVKDLMHHPVHTVHPETELREAAHLLVSARISGLPVVNADNYLLGIITEADFLSAIGLPCHRPTHNLWQTLETMFSRPLELREPSENVGALMTTEVICVRPEQSLHDALELMKSHRVRRLVVVDDKQTPIGMITRSDLVHVFFDRLTRPRNETTSQ